MQWKRVVFFIFINILVSAGTTLLVLTLWERSHPLPSLALDLDPVAPAPSVLPPEPSEPTTTSSPPLQAYVVGPGETLGEIAMAFGVSVEDLLAINQLTDADTIATGATIFVPRPGGTAQVLGQVEIVTVFVGDLTSEWVKIRNVSGEALSLAGWRLYDDDGQEYLFPQITLYGNGAINVYSRSGSDNSMELFWNAAQPVWQSGDLITLVDEQGQIQDTYRVP